MSRDKQQQDKQQQDKQQKPKKTKLFYKKNTPPQQNKNDFPFRPVAHTQHITHCLRLSNNFFRVQDLEIKHYICSMNDDYTIKDGRLINNAPTSEMGIVKAARYRKMMIRADKVRMIAEGNELANADINLFKKL